MDQSASNVLIDLLLWLSHSDGTDPGGAKSEMMKAVVLMLLLLVDKKGSDASPGLFLMITSLPSYCISFQGAAGPARQWEDLSWNLALINPTVHHTATFFPKGGSILVNGKVKWFPEK